MKSNIGDKARIQHISDAIKEVEAYITNSSYEDFPASVISPSPNFSIPNHIVFVIF